MDLSAEEFAAPLRRVVRGRKQPGTAPGGIAGGDGYETERVPREDLSSRLWRGAPTGSGDGGILPPCRRFLELVAKPSAYPGSIWQEQLQLRALCGLAVNHTATYGAAVVSDAGHTLPYGKREALDLFHTEAYVGCMTENEAKTRLGRDDWVLAGLRALVRGGIQAVKVEPLAREIKATKGSFYWHFKDLADLHLAMLELWEKLATNAVTAALRASGLDPLGQLMLLVDMVSVRPGEAFGGAGIETALREWGRTDPLAHAALKRVDAQRLADLTDFLGAAGVPNAELALKADLIYAAVIGLESLRLTTGAETGPRLRALVAGLVDQEKA